MTRDAKRYAVVIEKTGTGFGAYVPDLPDCVAAAETHEETDRLIRETIPFHIEGLRLQGATVPDPAVRVEYVEAESTL
jgi:predicted RNase H-like HicB family nuclease